MTPDTELSPSKEQLARLWWKDARRLAILYMLAEAGGPLTAAQLARQTGAAAETVSIKLKGLSGMGLVVRPSVRGGWYLTRRGWQLLHTSGQPAYPLCDAADSAGELAAAHPKNSGRGAEIGGEKASPPTDAADSAGNSLPRILIMRGEARRPAVKRPARRPMPRIRPGFWMNRQLRLLK